MIDKVVGKLSFAGGFLGAVAVLLMFLFMLTEVVTRYFFNKPINISVDVAELMLLVGFYVALAAILSAKGHISIDLVTSRLPPKLRHSLEIISSAIGVFWSALITWLGCSIFWEGTLHRTVTFISQLPLYPFLIVIPFGGALFFLAFVVQFAQEVRQLVRPGSGVAP